MRGPNAGFGPPRKVPFQADNAWPLFVHGRWLSNRTPAANAADAINAISAIHLPRLTLGSGSGAWSSASSIHIRASPMSRKRSDDFFCRHRFSRYVIRGGMLAGHKE